MTTNLILRNHNSTELHPKKNKSNLFTFAIIAMMRRTVNTKVIMVCNVIMRMTIGKTIAIIIFAATFIMMQLSRLSWNGIHRSGIGTIPIVANNFRIHMRNFSTPLLMKLHIVSEGSLRTPGTRSSKIPPNKAGVTSIE